MHPMAERSPGPLWIPAPLGRAEHLALFGERARALCPRALGAPRPRGALARLAFDPAHLGASARQRLAAAGARFVPRPHGREELELRADTLAELGAGVGGEVALFAHTWRAATSQAPPPELMGILNTTPDSFSDGGRAADPAAALEAARSMAAHGAAWIDIGGESTRPGAEPVAEDEEVARVRPVLEGLARSPLARVSIDTTKAAVARLALDLGAELVNDVSAGRMDPGMLPLVAERGAGVVLMHMAGEPRTMQAAPRYRDVVDEVTEHLRERVAAALAAGVPLERIAIDPGIGFGKGLEHNVTLLAHLGELRSLGLPVLLGVSRKAFLGTLGGAQRPDQRQFATAAAVALGVAGGATLLRVHDVEAMAQVLAVARAVGDAGGHP